MTNSLDPAEFRHPSDEAVPGFQVVGNLISCLAELIRGPGAAAGRRCSSQYPRPA